MHKTCYRRRKAYALGAKFEPIEIFNRDGWVCGLCGVKIDEMLDYPDEMSATLEHVLPLTYFEDDQLHLFHQQENVIASHMRCNQLKSDNMPSAALYADLKKRISGWGISPRWA